MELCRLFMTSYRISKKKKNIICIKASGQRGKNTKNKRKHWLAIKDIIYVYILQNNMTI